jgi:CheY-like chemotaxis protein
MIMLENVAPAATGCLAEAAALAHSARTVLLVEDEVLIRLMVAGELRKHGLKIIEAADAREAIALLQSHVSIDLLFTDVLTRIDGWTRIGSFVKSIRN